MVAPFFAAFFSVFLNIDDKMLLVRRKLPSQSLEIHINGDRENSSGQSYLTKWRHEQKLGTNPSLKLSCFSRSGSLKQKYSRLREVS